VSKLNDGKNVGICPLYTLPIHKTKAAATAAFRDRPPYQYFLPWVAYSTITLVRFVIRGNVKYHIAASFKGLVVSTRSPSEIHAAAKLATNKF